MKRILFLNFFVAFLLLNIAQNTFAQSQKLRHHQLGIDITNTLTFLKKNAQSYLLNYRYNFSENRYGIRAGLNLDIANGNSEGEYYQGKLGFQRSYTDKSWCRYYGIDFAYSNYKANASSITTIVQSASPLVGAEYNFNKNISVASEAAINFSRTKSRNTFTFDPQSTTSSYRAYLGYIGMLIVYYHF